MAQFNTLMIGLPVIRIAADGFASRAVDKSRFVSTRAPDCSSDGDVRLRRGDALNRLFDFSTNVLLIYLPSYLDLFLCTSVRGDSDIGGDVGAEGRVGRGCLQELETAQRLRARDFRSRVAWHSFTFTHYNIEVCI
jgi:hypothetical protein